MLAMVLNAAGDPTAFRPENRPIPLPTPTQSVLQIKAFGLNHAELITRAGGSPDVQFPRVIGIEAVGVVYDTTADSGVTVGQQVLTLMGGLGREFDGSYEEYALVPNNQLYPIDIAESWGAIATIPESFYTAYGSLLKLHLTPNQKLLVRGGSSSVGVAALLLAKALGIKVTVTTRDFQKMAQLRKLGAADVLIDSGKLETKTVFDGILELVGTTTLADSMLHTNANGYTVVTGGLGGEWSIPDFSPFSIQGNLTNFQSTDVNPETLRAMLKIVQTNHLSLPIIQQYSLTEIGAAQSKLETTHKIGKIIVVNR